MMEKRKMMAAALLPAIMIVLVGYLSFRLHEANEYLRDRIYYSSARLQDYLILMRAMKKEHFPERGWVKRFNSMLNAELSFVEHDWTWFFDGDDDEKRFAKWICRSVDGFLQANGNFPKSMTLEKLQIVLSKMRCASKTDSALQR
jgi:hypothetical protein